MRVCLVINNLGGGGAERIVTLLAGYLVERGDEVMIVTLHDGARAYDLDPRVEVRALQPADARSGLGKLLDLPRHALKLFRLLRTWRCDVCLSNLPRSNISAAMARSLGGDWALDLAEHAPTHQQYPRGSAASAAMRRLITGLYPTADAVIAVSTGVAEGLPAFGVDSRALHVIGNAISLAAIRSSAQQARAARAERRRQTAITVGRLAEEKDHATLLRAFARLRQSVDARLIIVGDGPLRRNLDELARSLDIGGVVDFVGWQRNPFSWMAAADVFVLSSRFEGFGNVLVEAMACGLPVVSTDCATGPGEILRGGDFGLLPPVGDVDALAAALARVLGDASLRAELAEKSARRAPDFDISMVGAQYVRALESAIAHRKSARR